MGLQSIQEIAPQDDLVDAAPLRDASCPAQADDWDPKKILIEACGHEMADLRSRMALAGDQETDAIRREMDVCEKVARGLALLP